MIQVHRSAAAGSRSLGRVQPRTCLKNLNMCSISKRRRNACQARFTSAAEVPAREDHSHSGSGLRSPGRRSTAQPDQGALDDRQLAVVVFPPGAGGQLLVQPSPGRGPGGAVPGGLGDGGRRRGRPGPLDRRA